MSSNKHAKFTNSPASQYFTGKRPTMTPTAGHMQSVAQPSPSVIPTTPMTQAIANTVMHGATTPPSVKTVPTTESSVTTMESAPTPTVTIPIQTLVDSLRSPKTEVRNRRVHIVLRPSFYLQVDGCAKSLDVSFNEFVRMALEHFIKTLNTTRNE